MILATKADAHRLGDKDFWCDQGVYIKRQEFGHPIKIVESNGEYTRDDGSIGVSYNIKRVYDISQTTSRMRAQPPVSHDARALLGALIYKKPVPIQSVDELPDDMGVLYDPEQQAIFVCRGLPANDLFCSVSKALAEAELVRAGDSTPETANFKAKAVSYILGKHFGVDVSRYAFDDIPADLQEADPQTLRAELSDIRDTAFDISARMARSLEQNNPPPYGTGALNMEKTEKRVLTLDRYEHGVVINALNEMRNDLLEEERPTDIVDEVLLKAIDAPTKKVRCRNNEARE